MKLNRTVLMLSVTLGLAHEAGAQRRQDDEVPRAYWPPVGMCRIWLDKVPPKQQPAPTDCPTAVRNRPSNGRVLFGDDYAEKGKKPEDHDLPFLRKFTEDRKKP